MSIGQQLNVAAGKVAGKVFDIFDIFPTSQLIVVAGKVLDIFYIFPTAFILKCLV